MKEHLMYWFHKNKLRTI